MYKSTTLSNSWFMGSVRAAGSQRVKQPEYTSKSKPTKPKGGSDDKFNKGLKKVIGLVRNLSVRAVNACETHKLIDDKQQTKQLSGIVNPVMTLSDEQDDDFVVDMVDFEIDELDLLKETN